MSIVVKGILSFPTLFTPKSVAGSEAKYSAVILLAPNDPQVAVIQAAQDAAKNAQWPSGAPASADFCFAAYDVKYAGKSYYDPRFAGWWALSCSAKADDRPPVVDENFNPVIDPSAVYSGQVVYLNLGISAYTKGTGGVGGWLNGVKLTNEEPPMGRLDGRPSIEQMFGGASAQTAPAPATPAPAAASGKVMTPAAQFSYEQYAANGWTDEQLIAQGLMQAPAVTPSWQ